MINAPLLGLMLWDRDFRLLSCSEEMVQLLGAQSQQDVIGHFFDFSPEVQSTGQSSKRGFIEILTPAFLHGKRVFNWMHRSRLGEEIPVEVTAIRLSYENDYVVATCVRDLREQLQLERADRMAALRIRAVMEASPLACLLWSLQGEILDCNQISVEIFGALDRADVAKNFNTFLPPYQPDGSHSLSKKDEIFKEVVKTGRAEFEWLYTNRFGEDVPCEVTVVRVAVREGEEDEEAIIVSYNRDLRELRKTLELNERLSKLAHFDALTGCLSRAYLFEKLNEFFKRTREGDLLSLTYFDFDAFKEVNDTYGHEAGDITLQRVVQVVTSCLPKNALVGRIGGDEFVIVLQGVERLEITHLINLITETVSSTTLHSGEECFTTSVSLGAAFKDAADKRPKDLLRRADTALYEAKRQGRNRGVIAD